MSLVPTVGSVHRLGWRRHLLAIPLLLAVALLLTIALWLTITRLVLLRRRRVDGNVVLWSVGVRVLVGEKAKAEKLCGEVREVS